LQQLPLGSEQEKAEARQQAQDHLDEAISRMDEFQTEAAETRYKPDMGNEKASQAVELMESARQELDQAGKALEQGLTMTQEQKLANQARKMAEQLAEDADALDESLSPLEKRQMLARLEAAKRLLESMSQAQWATIHKSSSRSGAAHVLTQNPALAPAQAARAMARQFWSIAIEAQKRQAELTENEPSDVRFYELENEFFEEAARFSQESVKR